MTYRAAEFCISCKGEVSWDTKMHSNGTCPLCGHTNPSTVVDTFKLGYRRDFEKQRITFLKIFTIEMLVPVRYFNKADIDKHGSVLNSKNDRIVE